MMQVASRDEVIEAVLAALGEVCIMYMCVMYHNNRHNYTPYTAYT
jgi:hypothetical protein